MNLQVANSTTTKVFTLTNAAPAKPYLQVSNSYLPLTTATKAGLKLRVSKGNTSYRAMEWGTVSTKSTYTSTSTAIGNLSSTSVQTYTQAGTTALTSSTTSYSYGESNNENALKLISGQKNVTTVTSSTSASYTNYSRTQINGTVASLSPSIINTISLSGNYTQTSYLYNQVYSSLSFNFTIKSSLSYFYANSTLKQTTSSLLKIGTRAQTGSRSTVSTVTSDTDSGFAFKATAFTRMTESIKNNYTYNTFSFAGTGSTGQTIKSKTGKFSKVTQISSSYTLYMNLYMKVSSSTGTYQNNTTLTKNGYKGVSSKSTSTPGYV